MKNKKERKNKICIFNEFDQIEQSIRSSDERANRLRFRIIGITFCIVLSFQQHFFIFLLTIFYWVALKFQNGKKKSNNCLTPVYLN